MKRIIRGCLGAAVAVSCFTTPAASQQYSPTSLSGFAVNALVRAYQASGLGDDAAAPLRLQPYIVTIRLNGDRFEIFFLAQTRAVAIPITIVARTGEVIWKEGDPPNAVTMPTIPGGFVLPGIIAGGNYCRASASFIRGGSDSVT